MTTYEFNPFNLRGLSFVDKWTKSKATEAD